MNEKIKKSPVSLAGAAGVSFFEETIKNGAGPLTPKISPRNDFSEIDAAFIKRYAAENRSWLDLGSGSGLALNRVYDKFKKVTAVEYFEEFSRFIIKSPKVAVRNEDIALFEPEEKYDLITIFGVMQYIRDPEAAEIYRKYYDALKPGGKLIVKNQFGVADDVVVDGYSEELGRYYFSVYRKLEKEKKMLEEAGYKNVTAHDIYPPENNRWSDTHFYALVCEK